MRNPKLLGEFIGHPLRTEWARVYVECKQYVQEAKGVVIADVASVGRLRTEGHFAEIVLHVMRAEEVQDTGPRAVMDGVCARQNDPSPPTVGLAPFGDAAEQASQIVFSRVGLAPNGAQRWITGAEDLEVLKALFIDWLLVWVDLHVPNGAYDSVSESLLREELVGTPERAYGSTRTMRGAIG